MNHHPFNLEIKVREIDPSLFPPAPYTDEHGVLVSPTTEEVDDYLRRAEGQRFLRLGTVCNGRLLAIESPWFPEDEDPIPTFMDAMKALARSLTKHAPHIQEPPKPLCADNQDFTPPTETVAS
jgi:hypothetical protein